MKNFIFLSSSSGTTMQAVLDAMSSGTVTANCLGLITDQENRGCAKKAMAADIPVQVVERIKDEPRTIYDTRLHAAITNLGGNSSGTYLAAVGWMWLLSSDFTKQWSQKIINVHPALLPSYPGAHAISDALKDGATESGMTIHFIDEGVDTGPIILQRPCVVKNDDTEETLKARIQELEKEWYPQVLQSLCVDLD